MMASTRSSVLLSSTGDKAGRPVRQSGMLCTAMATGCESHAEDVGDKAVGTTGPVDYWLVLLSGTTAVVVHILDIDEAGARPLSGVLRLRMSSFPTAESEM
nr:hypothetical protein CFP56_48791 [Quercus suber]